ncbi:PREDICTED: probable G-protein coupled receptor 123 [Elephantulus edwardii]|uniref:probable G-protein coupled receptor 123 n=1 Tax=Elephantulus edwardii TaxID=28737 RepID=UPI0003F0D32A|nr:PREDICTED: probable G-protein coupled receptor 123 [Elephantulus edwardii]
MLNHLTNGSASLSFQGQSQAHPPPPPPPKRRREKTWAPSNPLRIQASGLQATLCAALPTIVHPSGIQLTSDSRPPCFSPLRAAGPPPQSPPRSRPPAPVPSAQQAPRPSPLRAAGPPPQSPPRSRPPAPVPSAQQAPRPSPLRAAGPPPQSPPRSRPPAPVPSTQQAPRPSPPPRSRPPHLSPLCADLKTVLSPPQHPGELLHPVVYACTAVMLLCLLASVVTYMVHHSAIRISRKGRHTLLNFCFHAGLTFTVFAGGINRTAYPILCRAVGILLHYSTLATMLWIGVTARNIYKQVTRKAPPCASTDQPPSPRQPLLRFYLVSGGVPFIICGVTAATNIRHYGAEDAEAAYCWMAWEPSLGAFYGPVALISLVTCLYFLGAYVQLHRHPECRYELRERTDEQRPAGPEMARGHRAAQTTEPECNGLAASLLQNEHSFKAQLRAAAFTLFLFAATWAFGALAVSQGHFLDMVFSCLYGAFCVTLGLFVLIHHCAKREDVWHCWWSCCPSRKCPGAAQPGANGDCLQGSPHPGHAPCGHPGAGHCKMTNLQAAQSHAHCLSPVTPCCAKMHCEQLMGEEALGHGLEDAFVHGPHSHRCLQGRTQPPLFGREPEYAYHIPSSLDGSPRSSHTDSPPSSLEGLEGTLACCVQGNPFPVASQPEGSCAALYGCTPAHFEMLHRTQSLPFGPGQNGTLKGTVLEGRPYGADGTGNIRTGPWRNETTV